MLPGVVPRPDPEDHDRHQDIDGKSSGGPVDEQARGKCGDVDSVDSEEAAKIEPWQGRAQESCQQVEGFQVQGESIGMGWCETGPGVAETGADSYHISGSRMTTPSNSFPSSGSIALDGILAPGALTHLPSAAPDVEKT